MTVLFAYLTLLKVSIASPPDSAVAVVSPPRFAAGDSRLPALPDPAEGDVVAEDVAVDQLGVDREPGDSETGRREGRQLDVLHSALRRILIRLNLPHRNIAMKDMMGRHPRVCCMWTGWYTELTQDMK